MAEYCLLVFDSARNAQHKGYRKPEEEAVDHIQ
jgi:hypothetical protein